MDLDPTTTATSLVVENDPVLETRLILIERPFNISLSFRIVVVVYRPIRTVNS